MSEASFLKMREMVGFVERLVGMMMLEPTNLSEEKLAVLLQGCLSSMSQSRRFWEYESVLAGVYR